MSGPAAGGLSLAAFRALRYDVDATRLGRLLCPPYDVIDAATRAQLLAGDADNAVSIILPQAADGADPYQKAAARLAAWAESGLVRADAEPGLYVYEMRCADGTVTRGLLGAVELRDPADGVILPHENTMAGPVADRLALMTATQANLEPIYLVYDGGGAASQLVRDAPARTEPVAQAVTPDGTTHRLWAVTDEATLTDVARDLADRHALIADGHHRYATYREIQQQQRATHGAGPWDRGLTLLVDTSSYGPQVHAIHRVLHTLSIGDAIAAVQPYASVERPREIDPALADIDATLADIGQKPGFAAVLSDGVRVAVVTDVDQELIAAAADPDEPAALAQLDVSVLHRVLVERVWHLADSVDVVGYAHSVAEALADARTSGGTAVLLRPTPVDAVAAVAAAGARMPRKSTLFTPKPASGLVLRRFCDG